MGYVRIPFKPAGQIFATPSRIMGQGLPARASRFRMGNLPAINSANFPGQSLTPYSFDVRGNASGLAGMRDYEMEYLPYSNNLGRVGFSPSFGPQTEAFGPQPEAFAGIGDDYTEVPADTSDNSWITDIGQAIKDVAGSVTPAVLQYQAAQINMKRAAAGLPPIAPNLLAPQIGVQVQPSQNLLSALKFSGAGFATVAGIGLLAYLLLRKR